MGEEKAQGTAEVTYLSDYERIFHNLYLESKDNHSYIRTVATALRGRIAEDSRTKDGLIVQMAISLFPLWKDCYRYLYLDRSTVIARRVRYRLSEESSIVSGIEIDDLIGTSFSACIETMERFLSGTNPQSLHVFTMNTLPLVYSQHIKSIASRFEGRVRHEYLVINEPPEDEIFPIDNSYRESHLLGISKSSFYRILQSRDFHGSIGSPSSSSISSPRSI